MSRNTKIGVVIPAFNVQSWIQDVVQAIPECVDCIVIVDDASTDETTERVTDIAHTVGRVEVIRHQKNRGVGGATKTGLTYLLEAGCDVLVKLDGDGQMNPSEIPRMVAPLIDGWADYSKGNRLSSRKHLSRIPVIRLAGSVGLTMLTKLASGYWQMVDPQNGYVAITAGALQEMDLSRLDEGYFFENSMLIELNIIGARCMDLSMAAVYGEEASGISVLRTVFSFPPKLLRGFLRRLFRRHIVLNFSPIPVLVTAGAGAVIAGSAWGAYHWWLSAVTTQIASTGTVMLAVLPVVVGVQMLLQALVLDVEGSRPLAVSETLYRRAESSHADAN
ncbi:MAG: glycosyltransferase family 2 protein [Candidatus Latescibacterota bacterium]|nr:glycosyltransferase family 2 protein [Candidatus Latescibacterota bacterium]